MSEFINNKKLVGVCGLYCGGCDNYLAFTNEGKHLLESEKFRNKDLEKLKCEGCNSGHQSEHCFQCKMRLCAEEKNILHCSKCDNYPCDELKNFKSEAENWPGAIHRKHIFNNLEEINKSGETEWLKKSEEWWRCKCGQRFSYYEKLCSKCGIILASYVK